MRSRDSGNNLVEATLAGGSAKQVDAQAKGDRKEDALEEVAEKAAEAVGVEADSETDAKNARSACLRSRSTSIGKQFTNSTPLSCSSSRRMRRLWRTSCGPAN